MRPLNYLSNLVRGTVLCDGKTDQAVHVKGDRALARDDRLCQFVVNVCVGHAAVVVVPRAKHYLTPFMSRLFAVAVPYC